MRAVKKEAEADPAKRELFPKEPTKEEKEMMDVALDQDFSIHNHDGESQQSLDISAVCANKQCQLDYWRITMLSIRRVVPIQAAMEMNRPSFRSSGVAVPASSSAVIAFATLR